MLVAAVANIALTIALLFPDGRGEFHCHSLLKHAHPPDTHLILRYSLVACHTDAWYNTDAYTSAFASANAKRVRTLRPTLVALAVLANGFGVASAFLRLEGLLTVYIFGELACHADHPTISLTQASFSSTLALVSVALICSDTVVMALLLPHMFFLLRLLFDLFLILLASETRGNLVRDVHSNAVVHREQKVTLTSDLLRWLPCVPVCPEPGARLVRHQLPSTPLLTWRRR